jgi:SAM-dependent methyltransferase
MSDPAVTNKVDQAFWEDDYLGGVHLPSRPDPSVSLERVLIDALVAHAPATPGQTVLEIGCAPATWLVFYGERFGASLRGVEYTAKGAELSRANLRAAGLDGEIVEADFLTAELAPADVVLSLGFIEHFDDLDAVFERHVRCVAPGGRLVLGVPNYRGANRVIQGLADRDHLELHNLAAMEPDRWRRWAGTHGLTVEHLGYLGGFDPVIIRLPDASAPLARRILPGAWTAAERAWSRLALAPRVNHRWLSTYLLAVFRRAA